MPQTPKHALPYPAATDPVNQGAANFQNLATVLDTANLVPAGGAAGSYLAKSSATDFACGWVPLGGGWVPAGGAVGQVLTKLSATDFAAGWQTPTGGGGGGPVEMDYKTLTSTVSIAAGLTESTAVTLIAGNSVAYSAIRHRVEAYIPSFGGGTGTITLVLLRDTTVMGQAQVRCDTTGGGPGYALAFDTPAAGAHTYTLKAFAQTAMSARASAGGAGGYLPGFLRVTTA